MASGWRATTDVSQAAPPARCPVNRYDGTSIIRPFPSSNTDVWIRPSSTPAILTTCGSGAAQATPLVAVALPSWAGIGIGIATGGQTRDTAGRSTAGDEAALAGSGSRLASAAEAAGGDCRSFRAAETPR